MDLGCITDIRIIIIIIIVIIIIVIIIIIGSTALVGLGLLTDIL
jgi:hypothetical protein